MSQSDYIPLFLIPLMWKIKKNESTSHKTTCEAYELNWIEYVWNVVRDNFRHERIINSSTAIASAITNKWKLCNIQVRYAIELMYVVTRCLKICLCLRIIFFPLSNCLLLLFFSISLLKWEVFEVHVLVSILYSCNQHMYSFTCFMALTIDSSSDFLKNLITFYLWNRALYIWNHHCK